MTCLVSNLALMPAVTEPRPNYKNVSTKTITEVIKFLYLSSHNPGSPEIMKDFKQLSTYKPRP